MDVWLVKTDQAGNLVWNKTFGTNEYDEGFSVQQTNDDGYIITGYRSLRGSGYRDSELWLIKTFANGDMEWNKTFTEIFNSTVIWSEGYSVRQTSDGGFIVAGVAQPALYVIWLFKTDSSGHKVWERTFANSHYFSYQVSVRQTTDGGYIVAGNTKVDTSNQEMLLIKTDATGAVVWNNTYGRMYGNMTGKEFAYSVEQTDDGGYLVAGRSDSNIAINGWVIKTDAVGEKIWEIVLDPYDYASAAEQTIDEGYIIFGSSRVGGRYYAKLIKLDSEGDKLSEKLVDSYPFSYVRDGKQTNDGGCIMVADYNPAVGRNDVILIRTSKLFHDVAVDDIVLSKTVVGQGFTMEINVTAQNQGDFAETFNISISANTTTIQTQNIMLLNASADTLTFAWNTTDFAYGNYTISAVADSVPEETDTMDNALTDGWVVVTIAGDVDGDGDVDRYDFGIFACAYGSSPPSNPNCDIDGDGDVDRYDFGTFAGNYGKTTA
jgi:hypothetical protein